MRVRAYPNVVLLAAVLSLASDAAAQPNTWTSLGPYGGSILSLAREPGNSTVVYAVAERVGVFKSANGGQSWELVTGGLSANAQMRSVAVAASSPQTLYVGSYYGGVHKSTNGGQTWAELSAFPRLPQQNGGRYVPVETIAVDPGTPDILYTTASGNGESGVWRSLDGGQSWAKVALGLNNALHPAGTAPIFGVAIDPVTPTTVYAYGSGVFKSTNRGGVWSPIDTGRETNTGFPFEAFSLALDPVSPSVVYAGYRFGVHKSTNGGLSWAEASAGLPAPTGAGFLITALTVNPFSPSEVLAGVGCDPGTLTCGAVYRSVDGAASWTLRSTGLDLPPPIPPFDDFGARGRALLVLSATTFLAGIECKLEDAQPGPCSLGLHRTTDAGANWTVSTAGLAGVIASSVTTSNATDIVLGTFGWGAYRSANGGASWTRLNNGLGGARAIYQVVRDPTNVDVWFAATNDGVYYSADAGITWSKRSSGITGPVQLIVRSVAIDPASPQVVFAATSNGLWVTTNSGMTWASAAVSFANPYSCSSVTARPRAGSSAIFASCLLATGPPQFRGRVLRSIDGGANFSTHNFAAGNLVTDRPVALSVVDPDGLVYGAGAMASYVSQDGGVTWARRDSGLPKTYQQLTAPNPPDPPEFDYLLEATLFRPIATHATNPTRAWTAWSHETAASEPTGPFVTIDEARHWGPLGYSLPKLGVRDLTSPASQPTVLFAATNGGLWRLDQSTGPAPTLTSITPNRVWRRTSARVTATGAGIAPGAQLLVLGLPARNVAITGSTTIAGDVGPYPPVNDLLAPDALGDVVIANPDGQFALLANGFRFTTLCSLAFNPTGFTFGAAASNGTIAVSAPAGCAWTAGGPSWVTITAGASGNGDGTLTFSVAANAGTEPRSGAISFGTGANVAILQAGTGSTCTYTLSTENITAEAAGGAFTTGLTTAAGCAWTATANASWLTVTSAPAGSGAATISFAVAANISAPRTGTLTIAGRTVTVTQAPTNPTDDADGDGLPNTWEEVSGLNPLSAAGNQGGSGDPDGDGRTNLQEYQASTHPRGYFTRYLAEGALNSFFDVRFALFNVGSATARLWIRYLQPGGAVHAHAESLDVLRRRTIARTELNNSFAAADFSTVIESDQPIVVDRTMSWDATGYGSHAETGVASPALTWYLAEGSTSGDFALFYLIQNPNPTATTATIRFLLPFGQVPVERTYELAPNSRTTIPVDAQGPALASTDVSAVITCTQPVIVERAMYISRPSQVFAAGHGSAGVTAPATQWFLAEGATGPFFDLFVLVANPSPQAADVRLDYLLSDGRTFAKTYTVPGDGRFTVWVDDEQIPAGSGVRPLDNVAVSTTITSTNNVPIIVERAMWWPGPTLTPNFWTEAHNSPGATATGTRWALAEGEVGGPVSAETYVLIANTSTSGGTANVTLYFEDGGTLTKAFALAPRSRTNVAISSEFPGAGARRFATLVESVGAQPAQIVVERAMYTSPGGVTWAAGTNALGTRLP